MGFDSLLSGEWCLEGCTGSPDQRHFIRWKPGLALSPDSTHLYIIHADKEVLSSIDLAKGDRREHPIETAASWLERLLSRTAAVAHAQGLAQGAIRSAAVSADGTRLYVLTDRYSQDPSTSRAGQHLQVIELPQGPAAVQPGMCWRAPTSIQTAPCTHFYSPQAANQLLLLGYAGIEPLLQVVSAADFEPSASLIGSGSFPRSGRASWAGALLPEVVSWRLSTRGRWRC